MDLTKVFTIMHYSYCSCTSPSLEARRDEEPTNTACMAKNSEVALLLNIKN